MIERVERVSGLAADNDLDALIVGDLVRPGDSGPADMASLRWLTGFSGTSGAAIIGPEKRLFVTDFRYAERVTDRVEGLELTLAESRLVPALADCLEERVGYDDEHTSVSVLRRLEELVSDSVELVPSPGLVESLRRRKDAGEVAAIRAAAALADEAMSRTVEAGLAGHSEREVAARAASLIRELGGEPSFAAIVAAGPNGALPHAEPSERAIGDRELVVFDMGAELDGYCSDCTRTFAAGEPEAEARQVYELVLAAQEDSLAAIRSGAGAKGVDAAARDRISAAGHGGEFGHGVGHGVGVEVHEAPRVSQSSDDVLEAGNVVTVEPGVYVKGRFGVRIEDLVVVTEDGHENLSGLPKELQIVG